MKNSILFTVFILTTMIVSSQDYCQYNTQKGYNFGANYNDEPFAMMQQPDGRFLIFGTGYTNITNSFHIIGLRLFANGNLDPSFGNQGKVDQIFDQRNSAICAALQEDGKILVGGYQAPSNGGSSFRPYVARFNSDGTVDSEFGTSGSMLIPFGGNNAGEVSAIKSYSDGTFQVVSTHPGVGFTTTKLLANGELDTTYNGVGFSSSSVVNFSYSYGTPSSLISDDGTSYMISNVINGGVLNICVAKMNPDGTVDTNFGNNGHMIVSEIQSASNVPIRSALAFDGNILVSSVSSDNLPYVIKVNADEGELVDSFGQNGVLVAPIAAIGKRNNHFVKDEVNQEWVLLFGDNGQDVGTMRIDDDGNTFNDCGALFNIPSINSGGSQSFNCGLFDQEGVLRISGWAPVFDETSSETTQNWNFSWPYYEPPAPNPLIISVSPDQISINEPVELSIVGFGFSDAEQVKLISPTDTLEHYSFEIINNGEIEVVFNPEIIALGLKDLVVYLPGDTLTLPLSIEIVDEEIIDGDVNVYSRTRILVGGQTLFNASYTNRGNKSVLAAPLVVINENPYSVDFSNQPIYDLEGDEMMNEFVGYLIDQGIDATILNSTEFEDEGTQHHAFLTTLLSPQVSKNMGGMSAITESGFAEQHIYLHPNPIVESGGLLEPYLPEPGYCTQQMVESALITAIPEVDLTAFESCFYSSYTQLQTDLANIARGINDERLIPLKGAMMKLMYDLMSCIDNTYLVNESEFELFNAEMALLFATDVVLDEEFPCDSYAQASTYYHRLFETSGHVSHTSSADRSDPWGIGIDFNFCYGCKTMNDIEGASSLDPNEKIGPSQEFGGMFINDPNIQYAIHFENVDTAAVAAKTVLIIDSLDLSVIDISTFKFTNASWGENVVSLDEASGLTEVDLRPEMPNILKITTELDPLTGVATWLFQTLDTLSLMPTENIDLGFLPPNVTAPEGMGFVGFEVQLLEDIESGSTINNDAQIYFDFNDPITTNTWTNIFDNQLPISQVLDITDYTPGESTAIINWETENDDPNILYYNIYYNTEEGDAWIPWQIQTTENSAIFEGELDMTYYFMSVAVDSAFNVEEIADSYDVLLYMNPTGLNELDRMDGFDIFPNPASESVIINISNQQVDKIIISDMTGRVVLSQTTDKNIGQHTIYLNNMAYGIYNVSVRDIKNRIIGHKKLIKN